MAPTYRQAKMIAWKMLVNLIPTELVIKKYEVELRIILNNGSEICLKGCDNEESLKGVGISFVVLDEYAQMQANVWYEIIRPMLTDTLGRALFIGTPKGKNSLFELFIKGQQLIDGFKSWRFGTKDNPFIDQNEIKSAKQELPDRYFKQEYEASFEDYVGIVYPEFNPSHIIEPIYLQNIYPRIGTIDPAMSGTTAALKAAVDEDGNLFIYSEFYQQNKRVSDVTEIIKEENVRWWIDPASSEHLIQKEGKLYSLFNEYADNGIRAAPAENDVSAGINRVGEYFKTNKIKIFSTCKNLIYELERYHWSEERETIAGILKPKPYKKNDHLCFSYDTLVMMADKTFKKIGEIKVNDFVMTPIGRQIVLWSGIISLRSDVVSVIIGNQLLEVTDDHEFAISEQDKANIFGEELLSMRKVFFEREKIGRQRVSSSSCLEIPQRKNTGRLSYSSPRRKQIGQQFKKFDLYDQLRASKQSHENRGTDKNEQISYQESDSKSSLMAWFRSGTSMAFKTLERNNCEIDLQKIQLLYMRKTIRESYDSKNPTSFLRVKLQNEKFQEYSSQLSTEILQEKPKIISRKRIPVYCIQVPCGWFLLANGLIAKNCDCLRYMVMSRISKADMTIHENLSHTSPLYKMQELKRMREECR